MTKYSHKPVMPDEVLGALAPRDGGRYVDGTCGGAGHAALILKASAPNGWLFGCDLDSAACSAAAARLAPFKGRFELRQGNFADLAQWLAPESCDGVLLDLGVSSAQLDQAGRGFSFQQTGPLDMRMNAQTNGTAADLVNQAPVRELERWFRELGDEPRARRIARAIERERGVRPLRTTTQLADVVARAAPRGGRSVHPATRVFQALRMVLNDELGSLDRGLEAAWAVLKRGGRLAVITFHSGEVRRVKAFGRRRERDYTPVEPVDVPELRRPRTPDLEWVSRRAVQPTAAEVADNPRARSAQLRIMRKI